jgi:hypothetical protein
MPSKRLISKYVRELLRLESDWNSTFKKKGQSKWMHNLQKFQEEAQILRLSEKIKLK